jgi:hypothetical protein
MPNWTRLDLECVDVLLVSVDAVQTCQATTSYAGSGVPSQVMNGLDLSPGNGSSPLGVPDSPLRTNMPAVRTVAGHDPRGHQVLDDSPDAHVWPLLVRNLDCGLCKSAHNARQ